MAGALAQEKAMTWTMEHLSALWHAARLNLEEIPANESWDNSQTAQCDHVRRIFERTRVPGLDPEFYGKVCRRSSDANTKHPVLVIGTWRQGKSSLVNSMLTEARATTGRREKTTEKVSLYEMDAGEAGRIFLADTPGLEPGPDRGHDIMTMFRNAVKEEKCSPDILTDFFIFVIAGTPQGISDTTSDHVLAWAKEQYIRARGNTCMPVTILPVLTHGDFVNESDKRLDAQVVHDRLKKMAFGNITQAAQHKCVTVSEPMWVSNPDGQGTDDVRVAMVNHVTAKISAPEFKMQWSKVLTSDLVARVMEFKTKIPDEETDRRLFHRTVEATLATYGKRAVNLEAAIPASSWHLLALIERRLRGEESLSDRHLSTAMSWLPASPSEVSPFVIGGGLVFAARGAYLNRASLLSGVVRVLKRFH